MIYKNFLSRITIPLGTVVCLLAMAACELETSDNGRLDGFWHLERIDTLSTGGTLDLSKQTVFWSVQHKLIQFRGGTQRYYLRFVQTADSLKLTEAFADHGHEGGANGGDIPVTDGSVLAPYGVQAVGECFYKESLTGSRMILRSERFRLCFRKF